MFISFVASGLVTLRLLSYASLYLSSLVFLFRRVERVLSLMPAVTGSLEPVGLSTAGVSDRFMLVSGVLLKWVVSVLACLFNTAGECSYCCRAKQTASMSIRWLGSIMVILLMS